MAWRLYLVVNHIHNDLKKGFESLLNLKKYFLVYCEHILIFVPFIAFFGHIFEPDIFGMNWTSFIFPYVPRSYFISLSSLSYNSPGFMLSPSSSTRLVPLSPTIHIANPVISSDPGLSSMKFM